METLDRLSFLKQMANQAVSYLPHLIKLPVVQDLPELEDSQLTWIPIGYLEDWPPGKVAEVNQGHQVVISSSAGLLALDADTYHAKSTSPRRPLRLEVTGQIALLPSGVWPDQALLSVLTGNQTINQEEIIL